MKTTITVTKSRSKVHNLGHNIHILVAVAGHTLLELTESDVHGQLGTKAQVEEHYKNNVHTYETTAKAKALAIFRELIA